MPGPTQASAMCDESQQMTEAEMLAFTFGPLPPESEPQHSYSETQSAPSQGGPDHTHASMTHSEQMTEHETLDKGHQQALQPEVHTSSPAAPSTSAAEVEPLRAEQQSASIIAPPASVTPAAAAAVAAAAGPSTHPSNNNNRWPDNEDDSDEDDDGMDLDEELRQYMALKESMEEEEVAAPPSRQGPQPTTATAHPSSQTHPASTTTSSRAASNPTAATQGHKDGCMKTDAKRRMHKVPQVTAEPLTASTPSYPNAQQPEQLWVDKYAPRHFMDLLSDERTNREVVKWVKAWDATVFGSRGAARSTAAVLAGGTRGAAADPGSKAGAEHPHPNPGSRVPVKAWGGPAKTGGGAGGQRGPRVDLTGGGPQDSRPMEKIVLIAGPPGLGKTTLAHVVAAHCGYHPYEINASDDRTAAALTLKVSDAVHFQSVLGQRRPNCVIIDEIDGATGGHEAGGAVAALLKIAMAAGGGGGGGSGKGAADARRRYEDNPSPKKPTKPTSTRDTTAVGTTTTITRKKGSKRALAPLVRPIICICNDLFVPALRPLREVAKVLVFPAPAADKLVARLKVVCELEGIKVDKMALSLLADRTDCDIRSALNTLQFLSRRCPHIHVHNIEGLNIGTKDSSKSAFDIWSAVLWTRAKVRRAFGGGAGSAGSSSGLKPGSSAGISKLDAVCGMMADFGDYETVMGGLHENMLSQRYLDIDFKKTCAMVDTISNVDIMMRSCRRSSDFGLMRYFAPALYIIHALAAQDEKPHLSWPKPAADAHRREVANTELLRGWASKVAPAVLQACGAENDVSGGWEVVPSLKLLLSPVIRPLASHLMSPQESALLHKTACTMVDYSLKYDFADHDPTASPLHPGRPQGGLNGLRGAPPPAPRPLPLLPAIDTLHCFLKRGQTTLLSAAAGTAHTPPPVHGSRGGSGSSGSGSVPLAVRQMISRQATIETIHRAERVQDQLRAMALERQSRFEQHHDTSQPMDEAIANTHDISKFGKKRAVSSKAGVEVKAPTASAAESPSPGPGSTQRPTTSMWKPTPAPAPTPKPAHHKGSSNSKAPKQNWLELIQSAGVKKRKQIARAATGTGPGMEPLQRAATPSAAAVAGGSTAVPGVGASEPVVEDSEGGAKGQFAILYHYNEGYTNAVKRPLMMKELL
ncbi:MAG: hypothetical protein WDW38_009885 [Sanguina aurantia]